MKLIRVGQQAIYINTHEEERCINEIRASFNSYREENADFAKKLARFTITDGIQFIDIELSPIAVRAPDAFMNLAKDEVDKEHEIQEELANQAQSGNKKQKAIQHPILGTDTVFLLPDYHHFFKDTCPDRLTIMRTMKDCISKFGPVGNTFVVIAPSVYLPEDLEKSFVVLDYDMPSEQQIETLIGEMFISSIADPEEAGHLKAFQNHFAKNKRQIINAFKGFTAFEAETALAMAVGDELKREGGCKGEIDVKEVLSHKKQAIEKSGIVSWMDTNIDMDSIGGLEILKEWILKRKRAFGQEAIDFGLPKPRGILLLGCSGTGKSLAAKAIANILSVPLLGVNMGDIFGSLVGESEKNVKEMCRVAESVAPAVLFLDELEKMFAGAQGGGNNDSGTTKRVFGTVLTWMQERKAPVFVVATANSIEFLPPEFLRKGGRFDEIFFVDYPTRTEREAILKIQVKSVCKTRADKDLDYHALSVELENFTGAEIQSVVEDAMINAFDAGDKTVQTHHISSSILNTTPLYVTAHEKVVAMREDLKQKAKSASRPEEVQTSYKKPSLPENGGRKIV